MYYWYPGAINIIRGGLNLKNGGGNSVVHPVTYMEAIMPIEKTDYFQVTTKQKQSKLISIGDLTDHIIANLPKPTTPKKSKDK